MFFGSSVLMVRSHLLTGCFIMPRPLFKKGLGCVFATLEHDP